MPKRQLKFTQAIREALDLCMAKDPAVYLMGLGVPDPKGIFGTTLGLEQKYGAGRVMDMPTSENGMTGVALGSALVGMRPVITHQRIDFALLAMDQIVNQAAKWHFMFGGQLSVPMVIRLIVGRGWGQGPQHSQSLQAWFAHIPGLKVVMPTSPQDAKGLLIASIEDNNPVIFIEHRWLHNVTGWVPEGIYCLPLGKAKIIREGKDVTIVAASYMTLEALRAADLLAKEGIAAEIIDLRTVSPLDDALILKSVRKTGRLIVADTGCKSFGSSAEVVAKVAEGALGHLKSPPIRVSSLDCPAPTAPALASQYYPLPVHLVLAAKKILGLSAVPSSSSIEIPEPLDVPDLTFAGPF